MNMRTWLNDLRDAPVKKAMPILSFPCVSLLGVTVRQLISDSDLQAKGMKAVADCVDSAASVSMMDLSVEAEAFDAQVRFSDDEVPTVIGALVEDEEAAEALEVPAVGAGRTGLYVEAIRKACTLIQDRPVFAGVIGPFSLAGRLMGNVDPAGQFCRGTMESIREETLRIMGECCNHSNFVISSGCDIPPASPWENIDAFFGAVKEYCNYPV